jgi:hypothetical protein
MRDAGQVSRKDANMTSISAKLVLSALGIALLATPAFAKTTPHRHAFAKTTRHRHVSVQAPQYGYIYTPGRGYTYIPPPPELIYAQQHGNVFTPLYIPGFGNLGFNPSYPGK